MATPYYTLCKPLLILIKDVTEEHPEIRGARCENCGREYRGSTTLNVGFVIEEISEASNPWMLFERDGWTFGDQSMMLALCPDHREQYTIISRSEVIK